MSLKVTARRQCELQLIEASFGLGAPDDIFIDMSGTWTVMARELEAG